MSTRPQLLVDGVPLDFLTPWGDLEWTTCWPGGTESITFGVTHHHPALKPRAVVQVRHGGILLAGGHLLDPTRGEPLVAEGLHRLGEGYSALEGANEAATNINNAVDAAIGFRRLPWKRGAAADLSPSLSPLVTMPALDPEQVHSLSQFLDAASLERGLQWGVAPDGQVYYATWSTSPDFHLLPGVEGLAISRDGYASLLIAVYHDATTSTYETVYAQDTAAEERWGYSERRIPEPLGQGQPMTAARAQTLVDGLMEKGRARIGWTSSIEVQYGDVVNAYQEPVDLNFLHARQVGRLHGLSLDVADLSGRTTLDVPFKRTIHKGPTVTLEPLGLTSPMNDALAGETA